VRYKEGLFLIFIFIFSFVRLAFLHKGRHAVFHLTWIILHWGFGQIIRSEINAKIILFVLETSLIKANHKVEECFNWMKEICCIQEKVHEKLLFTTQNLAFALQNYEIRKTGTCFYKINVIKAWIWVKIFLRTY